MRPAAWDAWVAKARSVRIEDECSRRGIVFNGQAGKTERCGPCPKCGGEDRFAVNTKKQVFNCRGCSARGDVIAFVQFLDHSDFARAVEALTGEPPPKRVAKLTKRVAKLTKGVVAAEYQYHTADGTLAFIVERVEHQNADGSFVIKDDKRKKTFRQKRPDPDRSGQWIWNVDGVPIIPYRCPKLAASHRRRPTIIIVEGEGKPIWCGRGRARNVLQRRSGEVAARAQRIPARSRRDPDPRQRRCRPQTRPGTRCRTHRVR